VLLVVIAGEPREHFELVQRQAVALLELAAQRSGHGRMAAAQLPPGVGERLLASLLLLVCLDTARL